VNTSESRSEVFEKFWNVVLEKNGEDHLDRSCEKWRSITQSQGGQEYPTYKKRRKANWIGHILRRNCLLKHVIEGKLEGRIEMTGRRGRRRKQLLDDLKEKRRYLKLKEEALDRTLWRTRFGRGYGPVLRQTTEWMNETESQYDLICGFNSTLSLLLRPAYPMNSIWLTLTPSFVC
jgi:hypothetical protein